MNRLLDYVRAILFPAMAGGIFFLAAGGIDFPFTWGILVVLAVFMVAMVVVVDPGLIRERAAPGPGNQDRFTQPVSAVLLLAHWVLAGLDLGRFHISPIP